MEQKLENPHPPPLPLGGLCWPRSHNGVIQPLCPWLHTQALVPPTQASGTERSPAPATSASWAAMVSTSTHPSPQPTRPSSVPTPSPLEWTPASGSHLLRSETLSQSGTSLSPQVSVT